MALTHHSKCDDICDKVYYFYIKVNLRVILLHIHKIIIRFAICIYNSTFFARFLLYIFCIVTESFSEIRSIESLNLYRRATRSKAARSRQSSLVNKHKNTRKNINALPGFLYLFKFSLLTRRLLDNSSHTTRAYCSTTLTDYGGIICSV